MSRLSRTLGVALVLLALIAVLFPTAALAHERRTVAGKYQFVVGFLTEPAVADQMNGIDLRISTADGKPVEGLEQTLKAEVIVGGGAKTAPLPLVARFGQPGSYAAYFMPTRDGSYTFHFTGTIEGAAVDERFESGPGRFNDVQAAQPLQFPDKLPEPGSVAAEVQVARQEAATARLIGIAGLIVGILGLAAGGAALLSRRSGSRTAPVRGVEQN